MKKNTLIQSLGFSDPDHRSNKHDTAAFFVKQEDILKSILEKLKINYPSFVENPLKGIGQESKFPIQRIEIDKINDIVLETEVPITKGTNKDNKYTIGFLDGILKFTVEYNAIVHQQQKHIEAEVEITQDELLLIKNKKHLLYFAVIATKFVFYSESTKIFVDLPKPFLTFNKIDYYLTSNGYFIDNNGKFLIENNQFQIIAIVQDDKTKKIGNVILIDDQNMWFIHWQNDPKGYTYQNNCGFELLKTNYVPMHAFSKINQEFLQIHSNESISHINEYFLNDNGYFLNARGFYLGFNDKNHQTELYHLGGKKNENLKAKVLKQSWSENVSVKIKQEETFYIETKFHPTPASDILKQTKLYSEYLNFNYPWLILTFFPFSNLEQEELKTAKLNWIQLGGTKFNEWYSKKQNEVVRCASLSF